MNSALFDSLADEVEGAIGQPLDEDYAWWNSLRHHRLLVSGPALQAHYPPCDPAPLSRRRLEDLSLAFTRFDTEPGAEALSSWLDAALQQGMGLPRDGWTAGPNLGHAWSSKVGAGESVRPRRVWHADSEDALPLFVTEGARSIGVGRGRRDHARVLDWLRAQRRDLAVVTNGRQWRIVFATETMDAWCETDVEQWFGDTAQGDGLTAMRLLLSPEGQKHLREAIRETRRGHAQLSKVLGERVRQAVEVLVQGSQRAIDDVLNEPGTTVRLNHVYQAATRVAMRLVVVMFAESRQLLASPSLAATRDAYWESYSLQRLRLLLERENLIAGGDRGPTAWPRILALFRLLHDGASHQELTRLAYGGRLFAPGDPDSPDPILRAVAAFERVDICPNDSQVMKILGLMARAPVKVRQGRATTWTELPVDFSQIDVEYVGILYEGLLDYELHRAGADEPMVFLNVGAQPVLPLSRLERMEDSEIQHMVKELSKKEKSSEGDEAEAEEEDEAEEEEAGDEVEEEPEAEATSEISDGDRYRAARERAMAWASRAVLAAGLVKRPRGRNADAAALTEQVQTAARGLISRVITPGDLYLVRHGGTRKGSGTFYTKPQLVEPTVARTLEPLVFEGEMPRDPETVLGVKICDPACGSGSFLVGSLRYLTRALYESIVFHEWVTEHSDGRVSWEDPENARPEWFKEALKDFRGLNEQPEPLAGQSPREKVTAQLMRIVAERCIYGADLNPMAVDLAKLSMWIATMDPNLRFSFLDHKLKTGNTLVGCWFDRFQDYPALAWVREGGDKAHPTSVHHDAGTWTRAIAAQKETVRRELANLIAGQAPLFSLQVGQEKVHEESLAAYEALHEKTRDPDAQEKAYREWRTSPGFKGLKAAFDAWCAVWFWPADRLELAPTPARLHALDAETAALVSEIAEEQCFFHWELEFPDVFDEANSGFAAVLGNPPWETVKPNSKEFFSNLDPLYRTYGKQVALQRQRDLFALDSADEAAWIGYCGAVKAMSNWVSNAGEPFGDPAAHGAVFGLSRSAAESQGLHARWRSKRAGRSGYADPGHGFRYQGSADINLYKLFLEHAHALLRPSGRLGLIVPSGVYSDRGSVDLRKLFLDRCQWQWLFGFENRNGIFDIHRSFKFCPLIVQKGGSTDAVQTAFMRRDLDDWNRPERVAIEVTRAQVERFSPKSLAFLEVQDERDIAVLEKMTASGIPLGDQGPNGWGVKYATEFHMTNDSKLFPPREKWEAKGYRPDEYGHWLLGKWIDVGEAPAGAFEKAGWVQSRDGASAISVEDIEDVALPLYQGIMVHQFDPLAACHLHGTGLTARWAELDWSSKQATPQYLISADKWPSQSMARVGMRDIARNTDVRTWITSPICPWPAGHSLPVLSLPNATYSDAFSAAANSFATDWNVRIRQAGTHLTLHVLEDVPLPQVLKSTCLSPLVGSLVSPVGPIVGCCSNDEPVRAAISSSERLRLRCIIDSVVAQLYAFEEEDLRWVLRDCDHPVEFSTNKASTRTLDAKGFWRVDKALLPELRHTVLTQVAFADLQSLIGRHGEEEGLKRFLGNGPDDGWMLPETLRLADYGLGRDDRAQRHQPVAEAFGPRFYPWQLKQSPEEAWAECKRHAENLRLIRSAGSAEATEGSDTGAMAQQSVMDL